MKHSNQDDIPDMILCCRYCPRAKVCEATELHECLVRGWPVCCGETMLLKEIWTITPHLANRTANG